MDWMMNPFYLVCLFYSVILQYNYVTEIVHVKENNTITVCSFGEKLNIRIDNTLELPFKTV